MEQARGAAVEAERHEAHRARGVPVRAGDAGAGAEDRGPAGGRRGGDAEARAGQRAAGADDERLAPVRHGELQGGQSEREAGGLHPLVQPARLDRGGR